MTNVKLFAAAMALGVNLASLGPALAMAPVSEIDASSAESAILSSGKTAAKIAHLSQVPSVGAIDLSFRRNASDNGDIPNATQFGIMVEKHAGGVSALRQALSANPVTRAALREHNLAIGKIVGADVSSNGSLRLYFLN